MMALVLDELSAELILTHHVQDAVKVEADAPSRLSHLLVPPRNDAFYKAWGK